MTTDWASIDWRMNNSEIARLARKRRGIGRALIRTKEFIGPRLPHYPVDRVDWALQPIGLVPDAWLAESLGLPLYSVRQRRRRMGLQPASVTVVVRCHCGSPVTLDATYHELRRSFCSDSCRRRAREMPRKLRYSVLKRDGFKCVYCGAGPPASPLHIDHVLAVCYGGLTVEENLVTSCEDCNLGKSTTPCPPFQNWEQT